MPKVVQLILFLPISYLKGGYVCEPKTLDDITLISHLYFPAANCLEKCSEKILALVLITTEFKLMNWLLFPLKSSENQIFSDDFRGNRTCLIHLYSLNIKGEIRRRFLTKTLILCFKKLQFLHFFPKTSQHWKNLPPSRENNSFVLKCTS